MNKTLEVLNNRFSVRKFKDENINENTLNEILNCGLRSASAGNLQPVSVIKIRDKENRKFFTDLGLQKFIEDAPVNLLFCLDFNRLGRWAKHHKAPFVMDKSFNHFWVGFQDVIILAQSIETAANSMGIGSCYIGTTLQIMQEIKDHFKLPNGVVPVVLLPMGYINQEPKIANKLDLETMIHDEVYQDMPIEELTKKYLDKYGEPKLILNEERTQQILEVVKEVDGMDQANIVKEYLSTQEKVSMPMRYFGLHYVANHMAKYNSDLLEFLYSNGFIWTKGENHPKQ